MSKFFFFSTTVLLFSLINSVICQTISARRNAGCALISNSIYCYGGVPIKSDQSLNVQHIGFDLQQLHGITDLDDTKIRWVMVTDVINSTQATIRPRGYQGSAAAMSDNSYVMYGGVVRDSFLNYNPQTHTWRTLQVDPNVNATYRNTVVNIGDDMFWLWGGENFPDFRNYLQNAANIYDYKAERWVNRIVEDNVPMRTEHSATLALDGGIYILGGATRYPDGNFSYSNFNEVRKFDTKSSQWSYINATGHIASPRVSHTATQLPNKNQLLIYGGINSDPVYLAAHNGQAAPSADYCIIFDYSSNTFQNIDIPALPNLINNRYGHFAEAYNETYIVMAFGFIDATRPATTLSVLNISNPTNPQWVRSFPALPNGDNAISSGLSGGIIAAIVVPVVVVVLVAIAAAMYFYRKREKKYKFPKDPFVIDESDPRLNTNDETFDNIPPGEPADTTESSKTAAYVKPSIEDEKINCIKPNEDYNDDNVQHIKLISADVTDNNSTVKRSEYTEKPFGNEP